MKNNFKDTNTILVQGWMINSYNLSGNNLLIYALIYGFSQDGESEFFGSLNYICTAVNCSKPTVIKSLNFLIEKGLILKTQNSINGNTFSKYKTIIKNFTPCKESLPVNNLNSSGKESLSTGKESLHNNNIYNNTNSNKEEKTFFSDLNTLDTETNKQLKKEKKESARENEIDFTKLLSYYNSVLNKSCRVFPENVKKAFNLRVKEGYLKEDIKKVIDNSFNDELHKENNYKYVTLEFLSRPKIFERYASMEHQKPIKKEKGGFTNY